MVGDGERSINSTFRAFSQVHPSVAGPPERNCVLLFYIITQIPTFPATAVIYSTVGMLERRKWDSLFLALCLSLSPSLFLALRLSVCLSLSLSNVCVCPCLSVYLSLCLSICLSVCLSLCLSLSQQKLLCFRRVLGPYVFNIIMGLLTMIISFSMVKTDICGFSAKTTVIP